MHGQRSPNWSNCVVSIFNAYGLHCQLLSFLVTLPGAQAQRLHCDSEGVHHDDDLPVPELLQDEATYFAMTPLPLKCEPEENFFEIETVPHAVDSPCVQSKITAVGASMTKGVERLTIIDFMERLRVHEAVHFTFRAPRPRQGEGANPNEDIYITEEEW